MSEPPICPNCGGKGPGVFNEPNVCDDEKHIAAAMYLLQKAIVLREQPGNGWPTIHACLRDAAIHCEAARKLWKEAMEQKDQIENEVFGDDSRNQ